FSTNFTANRRVSELTVANEDYSQTFLQTMKIIEDAENNGSPPEKLGRAICKLVNCRNPRLRTKVGRFDQVVFAKCKCLLPGPIVQWVVRTFYKL
ncbi:MAG: SDR family NAD(P)-dependent oxidoreductase, partial [Mucinivorans sp.]